LKADDDSGHPGPGERAASPEELLTQLCGSIFTSLGRRDQRLRAEQYVRGLLTARGRKTLRNIAEQIGGEPVRQSVHHFISGSSWDWTEVRRALALTAERLLQPQAWVVRPTVIPRAGEHSVGVEEQFVPHLGQAVTGQQAFGAWLASAGAAVPGNWRLVLSRSWLEDPERRSRAGVPEGIGADPLEACAADVVLTALTDWGVRPRPVVLDSEGLDPGECLRHFDRAGVPVTVRIGTRTRLRIDCKALRGYNDEEIPAGRLVASMKRMRRPVEWQDEWGRQVHRNVAAVIPVVLPGVCEPGRSTERPLLLIAHWPVRERRHARLWLTSASHLPVATLLALTDLTDVVARDSAAISENVGMRDFGGRSFQGWHRHVTMASVAHLVAVAAGAEHFPATGVAAVPRAG